MKRWTKWTAYELEMLEKHYPNGGAVAVRKFVNRDRHSIVKKAHKVGIGCDRERQVVDTLSLTPVPRMDLLESLACIQLRKWGGPVNRDVPMRWVA